MSEVGKLYVTIRAKSNLDLRPHLTAQANTLHDEIGQDLQGFGGILRCTECGTESELGKVGDYMKYGWPKCCGYTMRWVTAKELMERGTVDG